MLTLLLLFFACSGDDAETSTSTPVTGEIQSPENISSEKAPVADNAGDKTPPNSDSGSRNLEITETGVRVRLPALNAQQGTSKYCFFQAMPNMDVGMTGISFETGNAVQFVRLQGVSSQTVNVNINKWVDCATLGTGIPTKSVYEMVGIDLNTATPKTLFNGFEWFSLPEQMAFGFPGADLWLYEVTLSDSSELENIAVNTNVSTKPTTEIERWAGVIDIVMEGTGSNTFETGCEFSKDLEILSIFGHSRPNKGTWSVQCGEDEIFAVESSLFAKDIPPLKNFETPKGISAGTKCSLKCDWDGDTGTICLASLVATSIEKPTRCVDGKVTY